MKHLKIYEELELAGFTYIVVMLYTTKKEDLIPTAEQFITFARSKKFIGEMIESNDPQAIAVKFVGLVTLEDLYKKIPKLSPIRVSSYRGLYPFIKMSVWQKGTNKVLRITYIKDVGFFQGDL
jgi:hypothetical protein